MDKNYYNRIIQTISAIDEVVNTFINTILHHPEFQRLESNWRCLFFLLKDPDPLKYTLIKILDLSYEEFQLDLGCAIEFDQSQLFIKIYEQEYDHPGGQPYGLLIGNYEFNPTPQECHTLRMMMEIAALAFAPYISNVSSAMFGVNHFSEMNLTLKIEDLYKLPRYRKWLELRKQKEARFVALTLPHFLLRKLYNQYSDKPNHRFFQESPVSEKDYLWGNAAFALAYTVSRCFIQTGWLGEIYGECGGTIADLTRSTFSIDNTIDTSKMVTDIYLTQQQVKILDSLGFISLRDHYTHQTAVFYNGGTIESCAKPSKLNHMLCISRFVHSIKIMMRDKIGKFTNAESSEQFLQKWLLQYCAASQAISDNTRAKYPLHEAKVKIQPHENKADTLTCILQLKPYFETDTVFETHLELHNK